MPRSGIYGVADGFERKQFLLKGKMSDGYGSRPTI